ncbi:glycoside hydrolase family 2 TIM barrel-domain containing protein [Egicoccus sp. AB-alg6-2]|uniref:glycoside hydrolase family 2 protein n=1 Tax=Egicoccus sp. AB-alg6-2 TaxID=3242692 RepID=UPI00359E5337
MTTTPTLPPTAPSALAGTSPSIPLDGDEWSSKGYVGEEWLLRRAHTPDTGDVHGWVPARVPGSVVADLVRAGQVPDPLVDRNSLASEWVAQRTWVHRRTFEVPADVERAVLEFDGIDHAARIFVNGIEVGEHTGPFTVARFDVAAALVPGRNLVAVVLAPAPDGQPHIGRTELVRTMKSRMTYGWDFCPRLVHLGIWDRVRLHLPGPVRITDLAVRADVAGPSGGTLDWQLDFDRDEAGAARVEVVLLRDDAVVARDGVEVAEPGSGSRVRGTLEVADVEHWWPNGSGAQPLYEVQARVVVGDAEDVRRVTTGFRRVRLVDNEDAPADARGYTLEVNGRRIYLQGWNWVPMDIHHGVEDPQRLTHLLEMAADAGTNLLRVWGGGLIEKADFYATCDRLGILVWQEFPLSSSMHGSVPSEAEDYVRTVVDDAREIVVRRRNHPSLALWCGGNELDGRDGRPADGGQPVLAALAAVVAELDLGRPWLPTSPTGPTATLTAAALEQDPDALHDVHGPWEHQGPAAHRRLYNRSTSLLHSEFGVEGMADLTTIEAYLDEARRWPADRSNPDVVHRGDFWVNTPLLEQVFGPFDDLRSLVEASQFLQADGLRYALEANRRRQWRQSGSIPWQFNEPFPNVFCTSAVDYAGRPKAAYHAAAAVYAPFLVAATSPTQVWAGYDAFTAEVWVSSRLEALPGGWVRASMHAVDGRMLARHDVVVDVAGAATTEVAALRWPLPDAADTLFWLDLVLCDADGAVRATNRSLFATGDDLRSMRSLPAARLEVQRDASGRRVTVRNAGDTVAVGVTARDARAVTAAGHVRFRGGHLTLLPGESASIAVDWIGLDAPPSLRVDAWNTASRHVG